MNRFRRAREKDGQMQRIGDGALRVFKTLAGHDRDEPLGPFVIALYCILFLTAVIIVIAVVTGSPLQCLLRAAC